VITRRLVPVLTTVRMAVGTVSVPVPVIVVVPVKCMCKFYAQVFGMLCVRGRGALNILGKGS